MTPARPNPSTRGHPHSATTGKNSSRKLLTGLCRRRSDWSSRPPRRACPVSRQRRRAKWCDANKSTIAALPAAGWLAPLLLVVILGKLYFHTFQFALWLKEETPNAEGKAN